LPYIRRQSEEHSSYSKDFGDFGIWNETTIAFDERNAEDLNSFLPTSLLVVCAIISKGFLFEGILLYWTTVKRFPRNLFDFDSAVGIFQKEVAEEKQLVEENSRSGTTISSIHSRMIFDLLEFTTRTLHSLSSR
jgi:hypothetical protein